MNVPIICLVIICEALSGVKSYQSSSNVGTVLFSPIDLGKKHWSQTDLALLQARRYFQNLLPYPNLIETLDDNCVHSLLPYFHGAFSIIDKEATDPDTNSILTAALSDVIGGYLNMWVLPVAKFSYYGGTISKDSAVKLFEFYKDIKNHLGNNGKGWRNLDENTLNSITINVAAPSRTYTRSMKNPCDHLSYYEKTPKGIIVPTPEIIWDINSYTMFVPLRNESLVPLSLANASNSLFKYYDVAKNCIRQSNPVQLDDFEDRFQTWLTTNVVPHLYDEHLYLALGSVLTLLNETNNSYNKIFTSIPNKITCLGQNSYIASVKSHKILIIWIVLFFEIVWCIPSLFYLLCCKKKRKEKKSCFSILTAVSDNSAPFSLSTNKTQINKEQSVVFQKPKTRNLEIETQCPKHQISRQSISTCTRSNFTSAVYSNDLLKIVNETNSKKYLKKVTQNDTINSSSKTLVVGGDKNKDYSNICKESPEGVVKDIYARDQSQRSILDLMSTKTVTLITNDKSASKPNNTTSSHMHNKTEKTGSGFKANNIRKKLDTNEPTEKNCDTICPCKPCFKTKPVKCTQQENKHIDESQNRKLLNKKTIKQKSSHVQRNEKKKDKTSKSSKRFVEITIDRPEAEISVGITSQLIDQFLDYEKSSEVSFQVKESTNIKKPSKTRNDEISNPKSVDLINTKCVLSECLKSSESNKANVEDLKRDTLNSVIEFTKYEKAQTEFTETIDCSRRTHVKQQSSEIIDCSQFEKPSNRSCALVECLETKQTSNVVHEVNISSKSRKQSKIPKRFLKINTATCSINPPSTIETSTPIPKRKSLIPRRISAVDDSFIPNKNELKQDKSKKLNITL